MDWHPNHALRAVDGARVEAARRFPVHELECRVPSFVADRIRVDLSGADTIEEPQGKAAGNQRACSRVVGLQDSACAIAAANRVETICDIADGLIPARRLETTRAFGSNPLQGARQAHARIAPDPVVTNRTFAAQRAPADAVFRIAHHIDPAVSRQLHQHSTRIVAIPRAGGADRCGIH